MPITRRRLSHLTYAKMTAALLLRAHSIDDLVEVTGLSKSTLYQVVKAMRRERAMHISDWGKDSLGRDSVQILAMGRGPRCGQEGGPMKCLKCAAWSTVIETRDAPNHMIKRRRQCANNHRFNTFEVLATAVAPKRDVTSAAKKAVSMATRWKRDQQISNDPRPSTEIAAALGLSDRRVREIRAHFKLLNTNTK